MRVICCRPSDNQFWIGCSIQEAEKYFMPLLNKEQCEEVYEIYEDNKKYDSQYWEMIKETLHVDVIHDVYFNVSRDLSICYTSVPHHPFHPLWNAYSPFCMMDQKDIKSLSELQSLEMTYQGEKYKISTAENE